MFSCWCFSNIHADQFAIIFDTISLILFIRSIRLSSPMTLYEQAQCWQTNKKDSVRYWPLLHWTFAGGLATLTASFVKCADRVWPRVDNIVFPQCTMGSMQIPLPLVAYAAVQYSITWAHMYTTVHDDGQSWITKQLRHRLAVYNAGSSARGLKTIKFAEK